MGRLTVLTRLTVLWLIASTAVAAVPSEPGSQPASRPAEVPVDAAYPGLASGALTYATLADLPDGTLLRSGSVRLTESDLAAELAKAPAEIRPQLASNAFFLLEQTATPKLLAAAARPESAVVSPGASSDEVIQTQLRKVAERVQVSEADAREFYEQNKDMVGGAPFEAVKAEMVRYVRQQKQQEGVREHIRTLGQRSPIEVNGAWTARQAAPARDNPVDKARASGRPSLVDFGASGCVPCDMMTPILEDLKKKYDGKANVLFVHVRQDQVLAARYGVQGIPMQVFFDKDGREVFRHTGFYPRAEIEKQLGKMGVR